MQQPQPEDQQGEQGHTGTGPVSDAGEQLKYNRRDRVRGLTWEMLSKLSEAERVKLCSKTDVWPRPDYEAMVEAGTLPYAARLMKLVYDNIATKPDQVDDFALRTYTDVVGRIRSTMEDLMQDKTALLHWSLASIHVLVQTGSMKSSDVDQGVLTSAMEFARRQADLLGTSPSQASSKYLRLFFEKRFWSDGVKNSELDALGSKFLDAIRVDYKDWRKIEKELAEGWPTKKTAAERQGIFIEEIKKSDLSGGGIRFSTRPNKTTPIMGFGPTYYLWDCVAPTEEESRRLVDENIFKGQDTAFLILHKKKGKILGAFETRKEAEQELKAAASNRSEKWEPEAKKLMEVTRIGPNWRESETPITPSELISQFGLRGINFGNWVPDKERQTHTSRIAESFMDLACMLGVDPDQIGFSDVAEKYDVRKIGFAVGAQGTGKFAAHFVPGVNEINVTRTSGPGSVAHEWGHGLDHFLAVSMGVTRTGEGMLSNQSSFVLKGSGPLGEAMANVVTAMTQREQTAEEREEELQEAVKKSRKYAKSWSDGIHRRLLSSLATTGLAAEESKERVRPIIESLEAMIEHGLNPRAPQQYLPGKRSHNSLVPEKIAEVAQRIKLTVPNFRDTENCLKNFADNAECIYRNLNREPRDAPKIVATNYYKDSRGEDGGKTESYWATKHEMFARAFNDWVREKLKENGWHNEYLCSDRYALYQAQKAAGLVEFNPYLSPEELKPVMTAIDALVEELAPWMVHKLAESARIHPEEAEAEVHSSNESPRP